MDRRLLSGIMFAILAFTALTLFVDPVVGELSGAHSFGPTGAVVADNPTITPAEATADFITLAWFITKVLIASIVLSGFVRRY